MCFALLIRIVEVFLRRFMLSCRLTIIFLFFFFFFQAEDGIRDLYVTGVQTCALPISAELGAAFPHPRHPARDPHQDHHPAETPRPTQLGARLSRRRRADRRRRRLARGAPGRRARRAAQPRQSPASARNTEASRARRLPSPDSRAVAQHAERGAEGEGGATAPCYRARQARRSGCPRSTLHAPRSTLRRPRPAQPP